VHYTMGGLWVDYHLMTTIPGLFALGECNFSDHGANRLGASALMQGLADGYFVIPYTLGDFLAGVKPAGTSTSDPAFAEAENSVKAATERLLSIKGNKTPDEFHKELGLIMWNNVGMARTEQSLQEALEKIPKIRAEFWSNLKLPAGSAEINKSLEKAARVADFIELGELMARDAYERMESCGGHFRVEHQHEDGEAKRNDERFLHVSAWEYTGENQRPNLYAVPLKYEMVKPSTRSYK
jgi:succinate dehydrogenase / fumarate reductase, flavoprotein subunit